MKSLYLAVKIPLPQTLTGVFSTRLFVVIKSRFIPTNFKALPAITFSVGLGDIGIYCHDISWQKYHGITIYHNIFNFSQIMQ